MCSKAMETIQLERFDEFGYTYIAPRWVMRRLYNAASQYKDRQGSDVETDERCFFREYCKDLKLSPNNTQFLLDFNEYIDRNTPDSCEWDTRSFSALFVYMEYYNTHKVSTYCTVCCILICAVMSGCLWIIYTLVMVEVSSLISRSSASLAIRWLI